jgi:sugar phosphate isomerase/epimerase
MSEKFTSPNSVPRVEPHSESIDRRSFLARTAGGMLAGSAFAAAAPKLLAAEKRWPMRLSTSSIHFKSLPIEKACEEIGKLGFEAIDVWSPFQGCPHLDAVADRLGPEGFAEVLQKNNLKLYAFSVYSGGFPKYAELLGKCGGGVAVRGSGRPVEPSELTNQMKKFLDGMKGQADLAGENDAYLAIENHGHALLDSLDSFKAFVELNDHPRLGIALAPYHLQGIKASVPEAIRIAGKQLFFIYAWQRAHGVEQLPGIGSTDFVPILEALADIQYKWYVNPFMHGEPEPEAMAEALKKSRAYLLEAYDKAVPA